MTNQKGKEMSRKHNKTKILEFKNGVAEKTLNSWDDYQSFLNEYFCFRKTEDIEKKNNPQPLCYKDFIWRGQRCDDSLQKLESEFDRMVDKNRKDNMKDHRRSSAYAFRGCFDDPSVEEIKRNTKEGHLNKNHFWAIGQDSELKTPLITWSKSPFIAAFMAFNEKEIRLPSVLENKINKDLYEKTICLSRDKKTQSETRGLLNSLLENLDNSLQSPHRVIYALDYQALEDRTECFQYFDPLSFRLPSFLAQQGIFTVVIDGQDIESLVKRACPGDSKSRILLKIKIPNKDREDVLRFLSLININYLTMFPNVLGASKFSNMKLEIDEY